MKKNFPLLLFILFFLQACSLTQVISNKTVTQTPVSSPVPSLTLTSITQSTPTSTPKTFDPSPELMLVPEDIKRELITVNPNQPGAPEGFREHFTYPIGGIEGGGFCEDSNNFTPFFQNSPTIFEALSTDPWGEDRIVTCGWRKGEIVTIVITKPDGRKEFSTWTVDDGLSISYRPQMNYGMQLGDYSATFSSPSGSISLDFSVIRPIAPGMSAVNENEYYIFGLDSEEPVFILAYEILQDSRLIHLISWQETTADYRGELYLQDQTASELLAVSDSTGGLVIWSDVGWGIFIGDKLLYHQIDPCDGAPASRLQTYDMAYVLEGAANNVRSSPSISANLVGTMAPGTVLYVGKKDPVCADGYLWWYVFPKIGTDPTGWTAEGKGSVFWLAPTK